MQCSAGELRSLRDARTQIHSTVQIHASDGRVDDTSSPSARMTVEHAEVWMGGDPGWDTLPTNLEESFCLRIPTRTTLTPFFSVSACRNWRARSATPAMPRNPKTIPAAMDPPLPLLPPGPFEFDCSKPSSVDESSVGDLGDSEACGARDGVRDGADDTSGGGAGDGGGGGRGGGGGGGGGGEEDGGPDRMMASMVGGWTASMEAPREAERLSTFAD